MKTLGPVAENILGFHNLTLSLDGHLLRTCQPYPQKDP